MAGTSSARKGRSDTTPSVSGGLGGWIDSDMGKVCRVYRSGRKEGGPVRGAAPPEVVAGLGRRRDSLLASPRPRKSTHERTRLHAELYGLQLQIERLGALVWRPEDGTLARRAS